MNTGSGKLTPGSNLAWNINPSGNLGTI